MDRATDNPEDQATIVAASGCQRCRLLCRPRQRVLRRSRDDEGFGIDGHGCLWFRRRPPLPHLFSFRGAVECHADEVRCAEMVLPHHADLGGHRRRYGLRHRRIQFLRSLVFCLAPPKRACFRGSCISSQLGFPRSIAVGSWAYSTWRSLWQVLWEAHFRPAPQLGRSGWTAWLAMVVHYRSNTCDPARLCPGAASGQSRAGHVPNAEENAWLKQQLEADKQAVIDVSHHNVLPRSQTGA